MIEKRLGIALKIVSVYSQFLLDQFEETRYKEKMLVEKVGVQTQTTVAAKKNVTLTKDEILYFN